jgi:hypothetical protein
MALFIFYLPTSGAKIFDECRGCEDQDDDRKQPQDSHSPIIPDIMSCIMVHIIRLAPEHAGSACAAFPQAAPADLPADPRSAVQTP